MIQGEAVCQAGLLLGRGRQDIIIFAWGGVCPSRLLAIDLRARCVVAELVNATSVESGRRRD